MGQSLLEFSEGLVNRWNFGGGERQLGLSLSLNHNQINRETGSLLAIEISPDGEVLGDPIMLVEEVVKRSTLADVVALRL